ncbi:hypothetical protein TNCV_2542611 [Trichonephila clavipes]|nr:hypothetical protein TNCV_2542611 [Trichonephila clavipes]
MEARFASHMPRNCTEGTKRGTPSKWGLLGGARQEKKVVTKGKVSPQEHIHLTLSSIFFRPQSEESNSRKVVVVVNATTIEHHPGDSMFWLCSFSPNIEGEHPGGGQGLPTFLPDSVCLETIFNHKS